MPVGPDREGGAWHAARPWLLLGAALAAVMLVYSPVLSGRSAPTDGALPTAIARSRALDPAVPEPTPARPGWDPANPGHGAFRPLTALSQELDPSGPRGPRDGRPVNLALHLLNTALLFVLLRRRAGSAGVALSLALGWALLPRLSEVVAWSGGRADLLATASVLSALLLLRSKRSVRRVAAAGALLMGLLAKEVAVAGLVAAAWAERWRERPAASRFLAAAAPLGVVLVVYAALRGVAGATVLPEAAPLSALGRAGVVLEALGTYAWMILDPLRPAARIGLVAEPSLPLRVVGVLLVAGLLLVGWRLRRGARPLDERAIVGGPLLFVALGLALHVVPLPQEVVAADRHLYLPLVGLAAVAAPGLERLVARRPRARWLAAPALLGLAVATAVRVNVWSDTERFWVLTARATPPADPVPTLLLASVLVDAGLADLAQPMVDAAIAAEPAPHPHRAALLELAAACRGEHGDFDGARALLEQIPPLRPDDPAPWVALTRIEVARLDLDAAWARHAALVARFPRDPAGARLRAELEAAPEFVDRIRRPIAVSDPDRARALMRVGRTADAVAEWRRILAAPTVPEPVLREAMGYVIRAAPFEVAREARLDFLRHRINEPDPELDALLVARRDRALRLRRLLES